jgi:hypothetical protein
LFDSDKTTLLFDIKPSSLGTIFPGTEGRRYSAKWEENFPGYITKTTKMQDFVLTVLAFGSRLTFSAYNFKIQEYISFLSFDNVFALLVASWCFRDLLCDTNIPLFKTGYFPFRKS